MGTLGNAVVVVVRSRPHGRGARDTGAALEEGEDVGQQRRHLDRAQTELHGQGQLGDLATHPDAFRDAFPKDKPKDVLSIKPLQLEIWQTKVKTDYWGLLMNPPKG